MTSATSKLFDAIVAAPFGAIGIRTVDVVLRELVYLPRQTADKAPANPLAEETARQIASYFADPDFHFDLPLSPAGTAFQQRVWQVISTIPRGEVLTYGQVAKRLGSAPRAVGQACGANWYPLIIPCHRVTAAGGIGGFACSDDEAGFQLGIKRWLLKHEGVAGVA